VNANGPFESGAAVRIRGERWIVRHQTVYGDVSALDVRGADAANGGQTARFLLPFEPVNPLVTVRTPRVVRPTEWRVLARATLAAATPHIDSLRAAARARFDILPYQLEPALAMTSGAGCRVLIADEVGLGKTVQAGLIIAELHARNPGGRALVVCPAGLRGQWQEELRARFGLDPTLLDASGIARLSSDFDATANPWCACALVLASIDFIKRPEVLRALEGLVWDVLVLDEAHNLATRSDRATAASALASRARTVVMLSATPHSGDDGAFARLCALGDARGRFPLVFFRRTRSDAGIPIRRRMRWLNVRPTAAEGRMLSALLEYARRVWQSESAGDGARLAMSVLLRRAASSAESLARSVERRLAAIGGNPPQPVAQILLPFADGPGDDEEPTMSIAERGLDDVDEERQRLEHLLSLARLATGQESKVRTLLRWVSRVHEPVLVFTEYRDTLMHLRHALSRCGFDGDTVTELHGGLTRSERQAAESSFVSGHAHVLLATDAASEGLNLHRRCRCVINLEVPWSPVRLEQRIGRVDRIGQTRCVHAVNLIAGGSHEMTTVRRLIERQQHAAATLRSGPRSDIATAHAVLTGVDVPDDHRPAIFPTSIVRPDLGARAATEAAWIATSRRLGAGRAVTSGRPFVSILGRRRAQLCWVRELSLVDAADIPVWVALMAFQARASGIGSGHDLNAITDELQHLEQTTTVAKQIVERARDALIGHQRLCVEREIAICAGIRLRHARIAADLVQPGLFDRRAERRAASQSSVLEEALGQCQARLEALARLAHVRANIPAFRFSVLT
jgi:superfamily II DNA or RNA helicase